MPSKDSPNVLANANKKRLSVGNPLNGVRGQNSINGLAKSTMLDANDDEAEKQERRKSKQVAPEVFIEIPQLNPSTAMKKRLSMNPDDSHNKARKSILNANDLTSSQSKRQLTNEQLSELYSNCIKLSSENKINQKNTWHLNLIDYIDDVIEVQRGGFSDTTNFQAASLSLDASVKIYSCRVDSVHNEAFKVLGGLNRTERGEDEMDKEMENDANPTQMETENELVKKPKQKKIPAGGVSTLETNVENITVKKFDLAFDVDPLFKKTSASFDEGGAKGLLLNHLSVFNNCELIFDSTDAAGTTTERYAQPDSACDIADLQSKLLSITEDISSFQICPTFANFQFSKSDKLEEQQINDGEEEHLLEFDVESFSDEDIPAIPVEADMEGLDFGNADEQENNLMEEILGQAGDDGEDGEIVHNFQERGLKRAFSVMDMPQLITTENEFAYFEGKVFQNWAGPEHWKFRSKAKVEGEDEGVSNRKKGRKKEPFFLNFEEDSTDVDFSTAFASGKAATTLSAAFLKKANQSNNTLPPDVHYDIKMLTQLFNKPRWRVSLARRRMMDTQLGFGLDSHNDDWATKVDKESFVPDFDKDDDDEYVIDLPALGEDISLVEQPRKIEQIKINYAKTAKFVDIKALKETIWSELTEAPESGEQVFSDILEDLPNRVSPQALGNISVPFCFICLLHLANEKGLNIEQTKGDLTELKISGVDS